METENARDPLEDYVVLDLEMTGLNAKTDRILEVGAVRVHAGKVTEEFSGLINPEIALSEKVVKLTGITNEMAEKGDSMEEILPLFLDFLGEDVIIGQNVIFDYSFIKQWAVNHRLPLEKKAVDTLKLSRKFLPPEQKKDLESLCRYFQVARCNAHRALDDARETQKIFECLKEQFFMEHPQDFEPKPLCYKAKRQTPATTNQLRYLKEFAVYHKIELPILPQGMTRSEASRLTDRLIAQYGKLPGKNRVDNSKPDVL